MSCAAYFLRSCERSCPDIPLVSGTVVRLGRGPLTGITDTRVSRLQAEVTEAEDSGVKITQRGPNHSVVRGKELRSGESVTIIPGTALNLFVCSMQMQCILTYVLFNR